MQRDRLRTFFRIVTRSNRLVKTLEKGGSKHFGTVGCPLEGRAQQIRSTAAQPVDCQVPFYEEAYQANVHAALK